MSNLQDSHPNSNCLWCDWNSNGVNDDAEAGTADSDGDGHPDNSDSHAYNSSLWEDWNGNGTNDSQETQVNFDSDADGHSDNNDSHPSDSSRWEDWNNNGTNDSQEVAPPVGMVIDSDGDGTLDQNDSHPADNTLWADWNGNGTNDSSEPPLVDSDGDNIADDTDSHPAAAALFEDWNFNGLNDGSEDYYLDNDADGITNALDSHPHDISLWNDRDNNAVNDQDEILITDADEDGYADSLDSHPENANLWNDRNQNGTNDELEAPPDTDQDGVVNQDDTFPNDTDNDGLTNTEEIAQGTNPSASDTDGDGHPDGLEIYTETDPTNIDTDGDGLTDSEEIFAFNTDPTEPTMVGNVEEEQPVEEAPTEESPSLGTVPVAQALTGEGIRLGTQVTGLEITLFHGSYLRFFSSTTAAAAANRTRTIVLTNNGTTALPALQWQISGAASSQYSITPGNMSSDLAPEASTAFTLTFSPTTTSQSTRQEAALDLILSGNSQPWYSLRLVNIQKDDFWSPQDAEFADFTDSDSDGIPDRVEAMYAPLIVTANGDLDGDGQSNLEEYLAGRGLFGTRETSKDFDGDGLTNDVENKWAARYPGSLSQYNFADAYADPDGDGLLTIEELYRNWGNAADKSLPISASSTNPFLKASGPVSEIRTSTLLHSGPRPIPSSIIDETKKWAWRERSLAYQAWIDDGLLRLACRDAKNQPTIAQLKTTVAFYTPVYVSPAALPSPNTATTKPGFDHLPAGYVQWLRRKGIQQLPATSPASEIPPAPNEDSRLILDGLRNDYLFPTDDMDHDGSPTAWEAAQKTNAKPYPVLDWRDPSDSSYEEARIELGNKIAALQDKLTDIASLTTTAAKEQRTRLTAEIDACEHAQNRLGNHSASDAPITIHTFNSLNDSHLVSPYPITAPAKPAALKLTPISGLETRTEKWIKDHSNWLVWQIQNKLDSDHDGLINGDEYKLGLSPIIPDYIYTGDRDSDGDGFSDATELAAGTNPLEKDKSPAFTIRIESGNQQSTPVHAAALAPLIVQVIYKGPSRLNLPNGAPMPGTRVVFTATSALNQVLLAQATDNASPPADHTEAWVPKTITVKTGLNGQASIYFKAPYKSYAVNKHLINAVVLGKTAKTSVSFTSTITKLPGDVDGDGLTDAWELMNKINSNDAFNSHPCALHFGYHRDTPITALPENIRRSLAALWEPDSEDSLLQDYPVKLNLPTDKTKYTLEHKRLEALLKTDPDHDGLSNFRENQLGLNPRIADYHLTLNRDSDKDGFTNEEENLAGTNHLNRLSHPAYEISVLQGSGIQDVFTNDILPQNLIVQTTYLGQPKSGIPLVFTTLLTGPLSSGTSTAITKLADNREVADWSNNTLTVLSGPQGLCEMRVRAPASPGDLKITCQSLGIESLKVVFHASIELDEDNLGQDYSISIVQGKTQAAYIGRRLRSPLCVMVRYGEQPVENIPIRFTTNSTGIMIDRLGQRASQELDTVTSSSGLAFIRFIAPDQTTSGTVTAMLSPTKSVQFSFTVINPPPGTGIIYRPGDSIPDPDPSKTNAPHVLVWQTPYVKAYSDGTSGTEPLGSAYVDSSTTPPSDSSIIRNPEGGPVEGENEVYYRIGSNVFRRHYVPGYAYEDEFQNGTTEKVWRKQLWKTAPEHASTFTSDLDIPYWNTYESLTQNVNQVSSNIRIDRKTADKRHKATTVNYLEEKMAFRVIARAPGDASNRDSAGLVLAAGTKMTFIPQVKIEYKNDPNDATDDVTSTVFLDALDIIIPPGSSTSVEYYPGDIPGYDSYFPAGENSLVTLSLLPVEINVDTNNDKVIASGERASDEHPFDIWINDDDDEHAPQAKQRADYTTAHVDEEEDVADLFPVFLDVRQLVAALPPGSGASYKIKQADGALNFVETSLTRDQAFSYRQNPQATGFGSNLTQQASAATTKQITSGGTALSTTFMNRIKDNNGGVILVEGRKPSKEPLVLVVEKSGATVAEIKLQLSIHARILLMLHGMNSNTATWDGFVGQYFGDPTTVGAGTIRDRKKKMPGIQSLTNPLLKPSILPMSTSQSPQHQPSIDDDLEKQLVGVNAKTAPYPLARSWSGGRRRILGHGPLESYTYHVMSRTCGGEVFFDDIEKEALRRVLWRMADFCGVRLVTYCIMGNHFHALVEVPKREIWLERFAGADGEERLLSHLRILYSKAYVDQLRAEFSQWRKLGLENMVQARLEAIKKRFCDLSLYVKEVKERFSRWFNKRRQRRGTLWMDRYKSVIVEGKGEPLHTMATYIDLNPIRAGLVDDPKDYRWCGYAEAVSGLRRAQRGLSKVTNTAVDGWENGGAEAYRCLIFSNGIEIKDAQNENVVRQGVTSEAARKTLAEKGKLSPAELVRLSVRYFTDGVFLGSKEFVESQFNENRDHFSPKRKSGARKISESDRGLYSLRQLRKRPVG